MVMVEAELRVAFAGELWCVCPACPRARSAVSCAQGSCRGVTGRRWKTPPQTCVNGKKAKEGIMPSTQKSIYQAFLNELGKQNPSSQSSIPRFVCIWNCVLLCQPLHSCASIPLQVPPAPPAGIRNGQEHFKQRLSAMLKTSICLAGYLFRSLGVVLTLVKTAVLGIS